MAKGGKKSGPVSSGSSTSDSFSKSRQVIGRDAATKTAANRVRRLVQGGADTRDDRTLRRQGAGMLRGAQDAGGLTNAGTGQLLDTIGGGGFGRIPGQLEAATNPAIRNLQRSILPSIASEFGGSAGTGSGNFTGAVSDAAEGVAGQIAAQGAQLQEAERGRQFGAASFFPQAQAAQAGIGGQQIQAGNNQLNRFTQGVGQLPNLRVGQQDSGSRSISNQSSSTKSGGKGGALGTLAGGAAGSFFGPLGSAAGASAGNALFGP